MIEIDGSYGEGGGQILRTSVSLSAITLKPIRIKNIRAGRPKPGLKRQHMAGIDLTGQLVNAEIKGLEIGSTEVEFIPSSREGGRFDYDIGTAGSISLVLQAVLLPAFLSEGSIKFHLKGGTDVSWSPPVDYFREVFSHMLKKVGAKVEIVQKQRGHYPKGGGEVTANVTPVDSFESTSLIEFEKPYSISGISHCVRLPSHVAERQARAAEEILLNQRFEIAGIQCESYPKQRDPHHGPGSGIVLWAESSNGMRIGSDSLGKRGKRAEKVGSEAATNLIQELATNRPVDSHLCDMLVPYMALANGVSKMEVTEITSHLMTNIWAAERILGIQVDVKGQVGMPGLVSVKGTGFSLTQ